MPYKPRPGESRLRYKEMRELERVIKRSMNNEQDGDDSMDSMDLSWSEMEWTPTKKGFN